jgi:hypothetical protein
MLADLHGGMVGGLSKVAGTTSGKEGLLDGREFFLQFGGGYRRRYAEAMSRMTVPISYGELQSDRDDSSPGMRWLRIVELFVNERKRNCG